MLKSIPSLCVRIVLGLLLMTFCATQPTAAAPSAPEPAWVEATGTATLGPVRDKALTEALQMAQRAAVEQELGVLISSETVVANAIVLNDKILTRSQGYVKKIEKISESCDDSACTVRIRAQVERAALADDVAALARILPQMNYPTVMLAIATAANAPQNTGQEAAIMEQHIANALADKGFRVVESAAVEAEKIRQVNLMSQSGNLSGKALEAASGLAQVLIAGSCQVRDNGPSPYNQNIRSYGATLAAKAYETISGRFLAQATASGNAPHHDPGQGTQAAIAKAAPRIADELAGQIVRKWLDDCYNDTEMLVIVENVSYDRANQLAQAMRENLDGVSGVSQKNFLGTRAEFAVRWRSCNTSRFADSLKDLTLNGKKGQIKEVRGKYVRLAF